MHLSMFLAPRTFGYAQEKAIIEAGVEQALEADAAGFAAIYVGEQHHNDYEPYADPFTMAGYLAPQLKDAYLGTSVVPLVLHHPLMLLERINLLDQLTGGKICIGLSSGQPNNGTAFGIHELGSEGRARLFDQRLDVMRRLWAHTADDGDLAFETDAEKGVMTGRVMPMSYRVPHPLFAIGTNTPGKVTAAGERGDLVHLGPAPLEQAAKLAADYRAGLEAGGIADVAARMAWFFTTKWIFVAETDEQAYADAQQMVGPALSFLPWLKQDGYEGMTVAELAQADPGPFAPAPGAPESPAAWVQRTQIAGSPETVAAKLKAYEDAGVPHIHARWLMSTAGFEQGRRSWRLFVDEVMPRLEVTRIAGPSDDEIRPEFRPGGAPAEPAPVVINTTNNGNAAGGSIAVSIDGTWDITVDTPMGKQRSQAVLTAAGGALTGTQTGNGEENTIYEGRVDGAEATWKVDISKPVRLTLKFTGTVEGDAITGKTKAGMFPASSFSGTRAG
jgi:alkanesulfonate monooxygenase SsuD/methylene tetrahydromethanopterin reductase-like flavin-dependent oxidoreductase (luciferase family)